MSTSNLILKNLSLGYDREIYREISANAHSGEMVALVGPNGIGKSTLLKSIASIQHYRSGDITVDSLRHKKLYSKGAIIYDIICALTKPQSCKPYCI